MLLLRLRLDPGVDLAVGVVEFAVVEHLVEGGKSWIEWRLAVRAGLQKEYSFELHSVATDFKSKLSWMDVIPSLLDLVLQLCNPCCNIM